MQMIHLYTGDGKGKSTAALGLLIRAYGAGLRVLYCQFLKSNDSAEIITLRKLGKDVTVLESPPVLGFYPRMSEDLQKQTRERELDLFFDARDRVKGGGYDLAVFDELTWALAFNIVTRAQVEELFRASPSTELVITGGNAPQFLIDAADYVSEIRKIKHPFDQNIPARRGIEY